jgi:predicted O-methyltransferase YrrM
VVEPLVGDAEMPYLVTNAAPETADRFAGLDAVFDPVTRGHLTRLGLSSGALCLEVGAGSGSVARWMADQVGPTGRVLAVDLDPR